MSNLRNSNGFNAAPMAPDEIRVTETGFGEKHTLIDNGGLSRFHHFEEEEEGSGKAKIIGGGLVVALLLGAAGLYAFTGSGSAPVAMKAPASSVASNAPMQTALVTPPAATPAPTSDVAANMPDASGTTAKSPYDAAPVAKAPVSDTASAAPDGKVDKPVKTARAGKTKDGAVVNQTESEQTAQLNKAADLATKDGSVPVPLPTPPASSVASNGQPLATQSAPEEAPVAPAVTTEQQAVTPAPQPERAAQP